MDEQQLRHLEAEEAERARADAKRAMKVWKKTRDPKMLLRTIYGLENQPIGSFLNTGSLETAVLGQRHPCIATIYPFPEEVNLTEAYGVSAQRLEALVAQKYVIPLIQYPTRYEKLSYLHPVLRHKPLNYFPRSIYFYSIFFDETIDLVPSGRIDFAPSLHRLNEKAKESKALRKILSDDNKDVREYYDRLKFGSHDEKVTRIKENIWYRYASVACFLGEDITDYILEVYPVRRALSVLLDLHFMFDHAWTQGLLANMHNEKKAHNTDWLSAWMPTRLWWENALSRVLCVDIASSSLHEPRMDQLDAARSEGGFDVLEGNDFTTDLQTVDELRATLELRVAEINAKIDRMALKGQRTLKYRTVAACALGLAGNLLPGTNSLGMAVGIASGLLLPEAVLEGLSNAYLRLVKTHNVDAHVVRYISNVWSGEPLLPPRKQR